MKDMRLCGCGCDITLVKIIVNGPEGGRRRNWSNKRTGSF
jgi:hypothetical protein